MLQGTLLYVFHQSPVSGLDTPGYVNAKGGHLPDIVYSFERNFEYSAINGEDFGFIAPSLDLTELYKSPSILEGSQTLLVKIGFTRRIMINLLCTAYEALAITIVQFLELISSSLIEKHLVLPYTSSLAAC